MTARVPDFNLRPGMNSEKWSPDVPTICVHHYISGVVCHQVGLLTSVSIDKATLIR